MPASSGGASASQRFASQGKTYCGSGSRAKKLPYVLSVILSQLNDVSEANSSVTVSDFPGVCSFAFPTSCANDVNPVQSPGSSLSAITSSSKNACFPISINGGFFAPNSVILKCSSVLYNSGNSSPSSSVTRTWYVFS